MIKYGSNFQKQWIWRSKLWIVTYNHSNIVQCPCIWRILYVHINPFNTWSFVIRIFDIRFSMFHDLILLNYFLLLFRIPWCEEKKYNLNKKFKICPWRETCFKCRFNIFYFNVFYFIFSKLFGLCVCSFSQPRVKERAS